MLPRNNVGIKIFLFVFIICFFIGPAASIAPAQNILISFFQEHISAVDGNRCPMHPTCSSYASQAIDKHGPILGWIMACDRLVRCGRDETHTAIRVVIDHQPYLHDPLEANDFWWFEKDNKK